MNKLGFYVENTTVQYLRDALRKVLPPTVLIHAGIAACCGRFAPGCRRTPS